MPVPQLPDYEHTLALVKGTLDLGDLSECHGVACGLVCRQTGQSAAAYLELLSVLQLISEPAAGLRAVLEELHHATHCQFQDEQMRLSLWLPDDEEPLADRTLALAHWCTGFLAGLGSAGEPLETLSDEAGEALEDLREIAMAEVGDGGEAEQEEAAFTEIVEYIRVVALMLNEDFRGPEDRDLIH